MDIINLPVDDYHSKYQDDRQGKLKNNKTFSEISGAWFKLQSPFNTTMGFKEDINNAG